MTVWTRSITLFATLCAVALAAEEGRPAGIWRALLEPNEIDWPAQPEQVERFGTTWLCVQTKYCQLHFGRAQSDAARELAGLVDNVYDFYARLLETKPQSPVPVYLPSSKDVHHVITDVWGLFDWRASAATCDPFGIAAVLRPGPRSHGEAIRQLMEAMGWLFARARKGAPLPPWPEALAHQWWRRAAIDHCAFRMRALVESSAIQERIKGRFLAAGPARLGSTIDEMNAGARTNWGPSIFWGRGLCHYVVERYGLDKLGETLRTLTDVPTDQPLPLAEAFAKVLGGPLEQIEDECATFFGVALTAGRPWRTVRGLPPTDDSRLSQARDAAVRGDCAEASRIAMASLSTSGDTYTGREWAYLNYVAGFALDSLGRRGAAIGHYESALVWIEPNAKLYAELEAALVRAPVSFYHASLRTRRARLPWTVADHPVDLRGDEQDYAFVVGGTDRKYPFLLADGHFDRLDGQEKQRLTAQYLHALATAQGNDLWHAIEAVGLLRERRALPLLHKLVLRNGAVLGYRQCWVAARALYRIADRQSIPTLVRATRCVNEHVRAAASFALHRITGRRFRTPDEWQRWWAGQQQNVEPLEG